jgi:hypothetical protein
MNPRTAAEIALGIAGVWLIVSRVPDLGVSLAFSPSDPDGSIPWFVVVHVGLVIACGIGLLLLRRRIASWLVPEPQPDLRGSAAGFQAAAFSVIGVLLLAEGLADCLAQLTLSPREGGGWSFDRVARPLAQIAVGLGLFLGSPGVANIWQSLRAAGSSAGGRNAAQR